jgi:membrane protease YdiL (CAAX protease family)
MLSKKPWQPEWVLMFFGALFASFCLASIAALLLRGGHVAGFQKPDDFGFLALGTLGIQGVAWFWIFVFLRLHKVQWRDAFGWRNPNLKKSLLFAPAVLLLALPVVFLLQQLSLALLTRLGFSPENQEAVRLFLATKSAGTRIYFALFAVVIAPVAEEFIFRGILFPFIKQLGWPKLAWLGVSFLFALVHHDASTFASLFALALAFTWLYEKTDCLLAPIAAHSLFNAVNLVLLLLAEKFGDKLPLQP